MSEHLKKQIWTFVGVLIIAGSFFLFFANKTVAPISQVIIDGTAIRVELALTDQERTQGLSGHKPLAINAGMLFVFDTPGQYGFWMKDMLFSVDIIWISKDKQIVDMEKNVAPDTYPFVFVPSEPALYVLEVNAGTVDRYGWKVGDQVKF